MTMINGMIRGAVVSILLAVGCSAGQPAGEEHGGTQSASQQLTSCTIDDDCPHGFKCDGTTCFYNCDQGHISTICKEGYTCINYDDPYCWPENDPPPGPTECDGDEDCPNGFKCDGTTCFYNCDQGHISTICKEGYTCINYDDPWCVPE